MRSLNEITSVEKLAFASFLLVNLLIFVTSISALLRQPVLVDDHNNTLHYNQAERPTHLGGISLEPVFFDSLPSSFSLATEKHWWQQQTDIYSLLQQTSVVAVRFGQVTRDYQITYPGLGLLKRSDWLAFVCSFFYLALGIAQFFRGAYAYHFYLSLYLLAGPLFILSTTMIASRALVVPPIELKIAMFTLFASLIPHIISLQFAFSFPPSERNNQRLFLVAYGIACVLIAFYMMGWLPITLMSVLANSIVAGVVVRWSYCAITEKDSFVREQCRKLLLTIFSALIVYYLFYAPNLFFQPDALHFSHYATLLLVCYFVLINACDSTTSYRKQLAKELGFAEERQKYREDFHDNALNRFCTIKILSELSLSRLDDSRGIEKNLQIIKEEAQTYSQKARGLLSVTESSDMDWEQFIAKLRCFGYDTFQPYAIEFSLTTVHKIPLQTIPVALRVCIYHVLSECIQNCIKHSSATQFECRFIFAGSTLRIIFEDNGQGASTAERQGHYGLAFMARRLSEQGGRLDIAADISSGFKVMAELPIVTSSEPIKLVNVHA